MSLFCCFIYCFNFYIKCRFPSFQARVILIFLSEPRDQNSIVKSIVNYIFSFLACPLLLHSETVTHA